MLTPTPTLAPIRARLAKLASWAASNPFLVVVFVSVALSLWILREVLAVGPFQSADLLPPYLSWDQLYVNVLSGWSYQAVGGPNGASFLLLGMGFVASATHDPGLAEKLFYYPTIATSGVLAFVFLRYIGLKRWPLILGSLGYELCPWFTGMFFAGEPGLVWVYALFPLYAYSLFRFVRSPGKLANYFVLALAWVLSLAVTLQSFSVYLPFTIPIFALLVASHGWKIGLRSALGWGVVLSLALLTQASTIPAYLTSATMLGVTSGSGSTVFQTFGFQSVQAVEIGWWILALTGATSLLYLERRRVIREASGILPSTQLLVSLFFGLLYVAIPSSLALAVFDGAFVLWPYLDFDKFLLVAWLSAFLFVAYTVRSPSQAVRAMPITPANQSSAGAALPSYRSRPGVALFRPIVITAIVGLLVISAVVVPIQVLSNPPNGATYLSGNLPFKENQIPSYFLELRAFLLGSGASFGLGFRTLLLPQNPGSFEPFYVGEYVVPGFVVPSSTLEPVIIGFINNDSTDTSAVMSMMGIKYVAIGSQVPNPWWPGPAEGPPSLGSLGTTGALGNAWFPQGNPTAYRAIASTWPSLSVVYQSSSLTIYQNMAYSGIVYSYEATGLVQNITEGNYSDLYDQQAIGPTVIQNPSLQPAQPGWTVTKGGHDSLLSNGTMELYPGSSGMQVQQSINLMAATRYLLTFDLRTYPGYTSLAPANATPTIAGIYWNSGTGANVTGAFVTNEFVGNFSGRTSFTFVTPQASGSIPSLAILSAEPPVDPSGIFTSYSNVTLVPINATTAFPTIVRALAVDVAGLTTFDFPSPPGWTGAYSVTLDTSYGSGWRASLSTGTVVNPVIGPFGLLTFRVPANATIKSVSYPGQSNFVALELGGIVGVVISVVSAAVVVVLERLRNIRFGAKGPHGPRDVGSVDPSPGRPSAPDNDEGKGHTSHLKTQSPTQSPGPHLKSGQATLLIDFV
ncbi:MAG: hypothetical protein WBE40_06445 [Thermoplasmata archaeon]